MNQTGAIMGSAGRMDVTRGHEPKGYEDARINTAASRPPLMNVAISRAAQQGKVLGDMASRLENLSDRLLGGVPRDASNNAIDPSCSGAVGELEGCLQHCETQIMRLEAALRRLEALG